MSSSFDPLLRNREAPNTINAITPDEGYDIDAQPAWKKKLFKIANIHENAGSYARDHLANERTFLAWLRTALSTIGFGVGIAQFGNQSNSKEAGLLFVFIGIIFLVYSTFRYYYLFFLLSNKLFSPNAWGLVFVLILCFLSVLATTYLLITAPVT